MLNWLLVSRQKTSFQYDADAKYLRAHKNKKGKTGSACVSAREKKNGVYISAYEPSEYIIFYP